MHDSLPDIETLRRCFRLDRSTGKLYWRERPVEHFAHEAAQRTWNSKFAGKEALTTRISGGYLGGEVKIAGKRWRLTAGRVVLALETGEIGEMADHINGDVADNRPENLRWVNATENGANRARWGGKTLPKCVFQDKSAFFYLIRRGGKAYRQRFKTEEAARRAATALLLILDGDLAPGPERL